MCSNYRTHWWTKLGLILPIVLLAVCVANAQITVKGKVTDSSNEALPGVTIKIKNSSGGVTTDIDGMYSISVPDNAATLVYSFIGFVNQEIAINGRSTINVSLEPESKSLQEVVVVGYGTQKRATLTGSVSVVKVKSWLKVRNRTYLTHWLVVFLALWQPTAAANPGTMLPKFALEGFLLLVTETFW